VLENRLIPDEILKARAHVPQQIGVIGWDGAKRRGANQAFFGFGKVETAIAAGLVGLVAQAFLNVEQFRFQVALEGGNFFLFAFALAGAQEGLVEVLKGGHLLEQAHGLAFWVQAWQVAQGEILSTSTKISRQKPARNDNSVKI